MSWDEMTPEQRDQLVAEKVMDWKQGECDGWIGEQPNSSDGWYCGKCGYKGGWGSSMKHEEIAPSYSTSMDVAWKIIAYCGIRAVLLEHIFCKTSDKHGNDVLLWSCSFEYGNTSTKAGKRISSAALTPQEAICKAVLKAHGVDLKMIGAINQ